MVSAFERGSCFVVYEVSFEKGLRILCQLSKKVDIIYLIGRFLYASLSLLGHFYLSFQLAYPKRNFSAPLGGRETRQIVAVGLERCL